MKFNEREDDFTPYQMKWFTVAKIVVFVLGAMLLILCSYNVYNYLLKHHKFKQLTISLFYVTAIINMVLLIIYSLIVPYRDYCKWEWMVLLYGISYTNLILGLCQAGTLTSLAVQLQCLFKYSKHLNKPDFDQPVESTYVERDMLRKVKMRQKCIVAIVLIGILAIIAIFSFHIILWHERINEQELCSYDELISSALLGELYEVYAITRVSLSGVIDLWIAIMTVITLRMLQKETKVVN